MKKTIFVLLIVFFCGITCVNAKSFETDSITLANITKLDDKDWDSKSCDSVLGKIDDKTAPAYYLNFAFKLIKYIGIAMLLVLSIADFAKAIVNEKDTLKKAASRTIKRLIACILLFFLPIIITFILELLGWITPPTCGIGV